MANQAHIIVGCGGSGIRALVRLNELLSQDYYWRRRLDNDIYYVVVETDTGDMKLFDETVRRHLSGAHDSLYITPVTLSEGVMTLEPLVNRYFRDPFPPGKDVAGRERLLEHWWNKGPDAPFVAPNVPSIPHGAGQCPPVSFFLTWANLENLERKFDDLIRQIQRRQGGFGTKSILNFLIVAGLAGGTGRGSWKLIAFKLRQMFGKYNRTTAPRAFFLDASVFDDVFKIVPQQEIRMRVNALTGVSELSCWVENRKVGQQTPAEAYLYRLPNVSTPAEPESDVLQIDLCRDRNELAPINHAYLVFDTNGVANLGNHEQYCEMVGAAIYAALSKSSINSAEINSPAPYVGLATATFEVNAATLRAYFEALARVEMIRSLLQVDEDKVAEKIGEFFKRARLWIDITEDDPGTYFCPDADGYLFQRALHLLYEKSRNRLSALDRALAAGELDEVRRLARAASAKQETAVRESFAGAVAAMDRDPVAEAEGLARELFNETKSVGDVRSFFERLRSALDEEILEMPAEDRMPADAEGPVQLVDRFQGREWVVAGPRFNEAERTVIMDAARRAIRLANYGALKEEAERQYKQWRSRLGEFECRAVEVVESCRRADAKFRRELRGVIPDVLDPFDQLFTDSERPELALDARFGTRKFYRRELRPVLRRGEDRELLAGNIRMGKELNVVLTDGLFRQPAEGLDPYDAAKRLAAALERALRISTGIPDTFVVDHFSIRSVVQTLRRVWAERLERVTGMEERVRLEEHFEEMFGFTPERQAGGAGTSTYEFPEIDDFVLRMAASLARTCKPYWQLRQGKDERFHVMLFVPTTHDKASAEDLVRRYINDSNVEVEVFQQLQSPTEQDSSTANPFVLLAYATQSVHDITAIRSLDYYRKGRVFQVLVDAEAGDGRTVFAADETGGVGFVAPLYVREEQVAGLRWRPWWRPGESVDQQEIEEQRTLDAMLYAIFPGDGKSPSLGKVQQDLAALGWQMPLFERRKGNRYYLTRLPLTCDGGNVRTDPLTQALPGWDLDACVAPTAGLHNVVAALGGSRAAWRQRILRESETFWKVVLPLVNCAAGTPVHGEMLREYEQWLSDQSRAKRVSQRDCEIWKKMLQRIGGLAGQ